MIKSYSWVPWFQELTAKIAEEGERYLIDRSKEVDWIKTAPQLLNNSDENIDPFSFIYFLAQRNASSAKNFKRVSDSVHDKFKLSKDRLPEQNHIFPTPPNSARVLFHDGKKSYNPDLLWRLFRQAVRGDKINEQDFLDALEIKNVAVTKLTQALFLINPNHFFPIDEKFAKLTEKLLNTKFKDVKRSIEQNGFNKYKAIIKQTKDRFPECFFYEINEFLFLQDKENLIRESPRFFQVSTRAYGEDCPDYWEEPEGETSDEPTFKENSLVYTGGQSDYLTTPEPGDIILVRTGQFDGRAIGVVRKNNHNNLEDYGPDYGIDVVWINKENSNLSNMARQSRFSKTYPGAPGAPYEAFRNSHSYTPTFKLIDALSGAGDRPTNVIKPTKIKHPLNTILYGPPGTGKTYATVRRCVEICGGQSGQSDEDCRARYGELLDKGRVKFITFHQSYAYEDFIEGIRPVLEEEGDIAYKMHSGIFKCVVETANSQSEENFVLIIDEINRGDIAKIFGELITLIEPSRRIGSKIDETYVTLPYSAKKFGVPNNLYIVGTMNTADRSIQLLDTALRRRFTFIEMMPNYEAITSDVKDVDCVRMLKAMNERITVLRDREHQIGHTYLLNVKSIDRLSTVFQNQIFPLLQEHFFYDWAKIQAVLNNNDFVNKRNTGYRIGNIQLADEDQVIFERLPDNDKRWKDPLQYRKIYEQPATEN